MTGFIFNRTTCLTTNWMHSIASTGDAIWTISPFSTYSSVFYVNGGSGDAGQLNDIPANSLNGVSPAVYLSSDITLKGEGTEKNPYIIENS